MQEQRTIALKAIMSWRVLWTLSASAWTPRTWWMCRTMFSQQNSHLISRWSFSLCFSWVQLSWECWWGKINAVYLWVDTWEIFMAKKAISCVLAIYIKWLSNLFQDYTEDHKQYVHNCYCCVVVADLGLWHSIAGHPYISVQLLGTILVLAR